MARQARKNTNLVENVKEMKPTLKLARTSLAKSILIGHASNPP
jgi:hypothetical protein